MSESIPACPGDSTLALLAEGYGFGRRRFERWQCDAFACRLGGRRTIVLRGQDAARWFYEERRLTRVGAMPTSVVHSLQDEGSVQALSGDDHRARKTLFLSTFGHEGRISLAEHFAAQWSRAEEGWSAAEDIPLLDEIAIVLTRASLEWAGITPEPAEVADRAREFQAMIDGAGSFGLRNWRGRVLRRRTEDWARSAIEQHRLTGASPAGSPVDVIATWEDAPGRPLAPDVAAVELLNALRPVVAVGRFVVFAALALALHPTWRARVTTESAAAAAFGAEVRRSTPFFPVIAARPTEPLTWNGITLTPGHRVVLDLFATNRHPGEWTDADRFDPGRFMGREDPRRIVAQGTGDMLEGHRCPGEPATTTLLEIAIERLASGRWSFVDGLPCVDLRRIPAEPGIRPVRLRWTV